MRQANNKWPSINPAKLRKTVSILQLPPNVDGIGQPDQNWITAYTAKASIDDITQLTQSMAREFYDSGLIASRATRMVMIRWTNSVQIKPGDRVYWVDQAYSPPVVHRYQIELVENVEMRNIFLKIMCYEIDGVG